MNKFFSFFSLVFSLTAIVILGGCVTNTPKQVWDLPGERHKISVAETSEKLHLVLDRNDSGLSLGQKTAISNFVYAWRDSGHGPIALTIPSKSQNANVAVKAAAQAREILYENGLAWEQIVGGNYRADGNSSPPVILSFRKYVAVAKNCNASQQNLAINFGNKPSANFGCALAVNTAAMIANPHELIDPRKVDAANADRRIVNYEKYVLGESTGVTRTADEEASVSDAVE